MPDFCQDCTCGRAQASTDNEPITEIARERPRPERSFTAPEDWTEPTEGVEPVIPLRSKAWWNNPADGE
jgi:dihydroxy-acid dehydratase